MASEGEDEEEYDEGDDEEEEEEDDEEEPLKKEVWDAITAAFAAALAEHGAPPLALRRAELSVEDDGNGGVRTLDMTVALRATAPAAAADARPVLLRFFYHCRPFDSFCEFEVALEWRPDGDDDEAPFTRLASAALSEPDGRGKQVETHDVAGLTPAANAAMRATLFGHNHAAVPAAAALADHGLLQIALAACGAAGLSRMLRVDVGYEWQPDERAREQGAEPTTWLQHAARAAARAPAPYDRLYRGPPGAAKRSRDE